MFIARIMSIERRRTANCCGKDGVANIRARKFKKSTVSLNGRRAGFCGPGDHRMVLLASRAATRGDSGR